MPELLLVAGPGLFCMLLVLGHFLLRGGRPRDQRHGDARGQGPTHEPGPEPLQDFR